MIFSLKSGAHSFSKFTRSLLLTTSLAFAIGCQNADPKTSAVSAPTESEVMGSTAQTFSIILKPVVSAQDKVIAVDVKATLDGQLEDGETRLKLNAPIVYVMVDGIAERIKGLRVVDAAGDIEFTIEDQDEVPGGFPYYRTWTATRDVTFPISLHYSSFVQPAESRNGPAFGMRPSANGVSGSGAGFLLLPSNLDSSKSQVSWDLTELGPDAVGVSTFGEGAAIVNGKPSNIRQGWYMAGHPNRYPSDAEGSPFNGFWLGEFPYDVQAELIFVDHMYDYLSEHFYHLQPAPDYRVFLRQLDTPPFGGATALQNSFMLSRGPAQPEEIGQLGPRITFTHELIHQWVGGMNAPHGDSTWFIEGLTSYYEYTLPFRAGELSLEDYVSGLNELSQIYYTNPGREMSADEIVKVGFGDTHIRHVPYQRGAFYFADLDTRIRAHSKNTKSLDTLMERVFDLRQSGELNLTIENWAAEAAKETGQDEYSIVKNIHLDGALFTPSFESFGYCIQGQASIFEANGKEVRGIHWKSVQDVDGVDCFAVQK